MSLDANKALIRSVFEKVIPAGDAAGLRDLVAPDWIDHDPLPGQPAGLDGAEYVVTQPVFDLDLLEAFLKRTEQYKLPLIAGIWPLTSFRNAEFMVNELRVPVPEPYMERMRNADNADAARIEGVAIAREMVERVRPLVAGVQLSAPFGRYQTAIDVAQAIER